MVIYNCLLLSIRYQATCFEYSYWYILWTHGKNIMVKMCVIYVVECMTGSYVARIIRNKIDIWKNWYFICSLTLIQSLQCLWYNRAPIATVTGERRRWKSWASLGTTGLATQGRAALVHIVLFPNQIIWVGDCSGHIPFSLKAADLCLLMIPGNGGLSQVQPTHLTVFSDGGRPIVLLQSFHKH